MEFEKYNFGYSLKNIPLVKPKEFKLLLLDSINKFMTNLERKANVFLYPEKFQNKRETFGFKSSRAPDPIPELKWMKDKLYELAENVKFRPYNNEFLTKLSNDVKEINRSEKIYQKSDKTSNY